MTKVDLESAMAAVITSQAARSSFAADPEAFATGNGLEPTDRERLKTMGDDLARLTGSFVSKRATTLRWNARRTIALLGPEGDGLLHEFIDSHPATESFAAESARFCEFMVQETDAARDGTEWGDVVADMARFEQLRAASFWGAVASVGRAAPPPGTELPRRFRLRPGVQAGHFVRDLRSLFHDTRTTMRVPAPDPCALGFVHLHSARGLRVVRLTGAQYELVASLMARDDSSAGGEDGPADGRDVEHLARRGMVEWR